jgi:hypothetical protein
LLTLLVHFQIGKEEEKPFFFVFETIYFLLDLFTLLVCWSSVLIKHSMFKLNDNILLVYLDIAGTNFRCIQKTIRNILILFNLF